MPAKSLKQKKLMDAAAHNPKFAKTVGIPQSVAKDFSEASKGMKFGSGGRADRQSVNLPKTNHGKQALFSKGGEMAIKKLFKGKETYKEELAEAKAIKSGKITPAQYAKGEESEKKMARGGMTAGAASHAQKEGRKVAKEMEYDYKTGKKSFAGSVAKRDAHAEKEGKRVAKALEYDYTKGRKPAIKKAVGGLLPHGESTIQKKGHTRGKVLMKKGGKC